MNKKEFILLITITVILITTAIFCLFADSVFKEVAVAHAATSETFDSISNKIISGDKPLTDEQIIKLFSNEANKSESIQELIYNISEMIDSLAYFLITLALLQGCIIINGWRNKNV